MLKIIFFLSAFFLTINSNAQYDPYVRNQNQSEAGVQPQDLNFPVYKKETENRSKLDSERSAITVKFGKSIGQFSEQTGIVPNSISYRRTSDEFFFGLEYNSFFSKELETKANDIQFIMGKRFLWSYRFLPYVAFQAGTADYQKTKSGAEESATGLAVTADAGFEFLKLGFLKFGTGLRYTYMTFDSKIMPSANFLDLYLSTGIEF